MYLVLVGCRLEQADLKYRNRESRPEDLDAIENLRSKVVEQELECQKLVVSTRSRISIIAMSSLST